jgi:hypothetical protein
MRQGEYEQTVLRELRKIMLGSDGQARRFEDEGSGEKIRVEDVRLDTSEPDHKIVILLRNLDRPECVFGFDMEAVEWHEPGYDPHSLDPNIWVTIVLANFRERIMSQALPEECSPGEITWV